AAAKAAAKSSSVKTKPVAKPVSVQTKASVTSKKTPVAAKPARTARKTAAVAAAPQPEIKTLRGDVSQTTDASALASIDTSGYILPAVKVPGRRGRKP